MKNSISRLRIEEGKCALCGTEHNLQMHHCSYNPEIFMVLCVKCHGEVHAHRVGNPQYQTKCDIEAFRFEHAEEIELMRNVVTELLDKNNTIFNQLLVRYIYDKKSIMELLYGENKKTNYSLLRIKMDFEETLEFLKALSYSKKPK